MDSSFNDFEDNIRPPDKIKREILIEDSVPINENDIELNEALYLSLQEKSIEDNNNKLNNLYEEKVKNEYITEVNKRKDVFYNLLFELNKLIKYDKEIKEIYEIIDPVIDAYCNQYIEYYEIDEITYEKIFKVIGTIRTTKNIIDSLKNILIKY
jgi:hypothetical protein